jgi:hypothetical protein
MAPSEKKYVAGRSLFQFGSLYAKRESHADASNRLGVPSEVVGRFVGAKPWLGFTDFDGQFARSSRLITDSKQPCTVVCIVPLTE